MEAKNKDYTAGSADIFANFTVNEKVLDIEAERFILSKVLDKIMRLKSFINNGNLAVKGESVEDSVLDNINFMVLFLGLVLSKTEQEKPF